MHQRSRGKVPTIGEKMKRGGWSTVKKIRKISVGGKAKFGFAKRGSQVKSYSLKIRVSSRLSHKCERYNMCFLKVTYAIMDLHRRDEGCKKRCKQRLAVYEHLFQEVERFYRTARVSKQNK